MNLPAILFTKSKLSAAFAVIIAFFAPLQPLMLAVILAIFFDTGFGIAKAIKLKTFNSRRFRDLAYKLVVYLGALLFVFMMEKLMLSEFVMYVSDMPHLLSKITAITLCSIEAKSIDETFKGIFGISIWSALKRLIKGVKEVKDEVGDLTKR